MKQILLDGLINNIKKYYDYSDVKIKEIRYGLESLYLSVVKDVVIIIISIFIHVFKELCLLLLFYGLLRLTGFGVHAKKSIDCWISSLTTFLGIPLLIKYINIPYEYLISISMVLIILLSIYAPADTEKRPLINKKKRVIYKLLTIIISITYIVIISINKNAYINNILFHSMALETLLVLPITYKLFGVKYDNYKRYKRKEVI